MNDVTGVTPASFEPSIDYVVTKIPRFTFEKFPDADPLLTTSMKSVGEVMAIGRSFVESMQKALRSLETGLTGFNEVAIDGAIVDGKLDRDAIRAALAERRPERIRFIAQAMRLGLPRRVEWLLHHACDLHPAAHGALAAGDDDGVLPVARVD